METKVKFFSSQGLKNLVVVTVWFVPLTTILTVQRGLQYLIRGW